MLSLVSVATAVALFVSMRITQASLVSAFRTSLDALAGGAEYAITGREGVPPEVLAAVERVPGVRAAPLVRGPAVLADARQAITIIGIDVARDAKLRRYEVTDKVELDLPTLLLQPHAAIVPQRLAAQHGWSLRSTIKLAGPTGPQTLVVGGLLSSDGAAAALGGKVIFTQLATAQRILGRGGTFDRIDLALDSPATTDAVREVLNTVSTSSLRGPMPPMPPGSAGVSNPYTLGPARADDPIFHFLYDQFKTVLVCISVLASMIGAFIVYNSVYLSVVERAKQIGTLRALGARRGDVMGVLVLEAALLGLIAAALGTAGGIWIARLALTQVGASLSLIMDIGDMAPVTPWDVWLIGPLVGAAAAIVGTLGPARRFAFLPPILAIKSEPADPSRDRRRTVLSVMVAVPLFAVGATLLDRSSPSSVGVFVAGLVMTVLAVAMLGPTLVVAAGRPLQRLAEGRLRAPALLALDSVVQFPARSSLTLVAFGGSLAVVVAMSSLVVALKRDVSEWMDDMFVFDLTLQANDMSVSPYPAADMPGEMLDLVRQDPECNEAYGVVNAFVPFRGERVMLLAVEAEVFVEGRIKRGRSRHPEGDRRAAQALVEGKIGVSENFAVIHRVRVGDRLEVETPAGPRPFEVALVWKDHSWTRGAIFMDLEHFRALWKKSEITYLDIRVKPGTDLEAYRAKLVERWSAPYGVFVHRCDEIEAFALRMIGDWFKLANVQILLAVVIGGVGVANTVLISLITQSRRIGLLRAVGAKAGQIRNMLVMEAAYLGLAGGVLGCALGLVTGRYLLLPLAVKTSGLVLPFVVPYGALGLAGAAAVLIALGAAVLPVRAARRIDVIQAIGYE